VAYSDDDDLFLVRPELSELLPENATDWDEQRTRAESEIDSALERLWYRREASARGIDWRGTGFDRTRLGPGQLKRLSVLKTLSCVYEFLSVGGQDPDGYERLSDKYEAGFKEELSNVLARGLDYDWDDSDGLEETERARIVPVRLVRA